MTSRRVIRAVEFGAVLVIAAAGMMVTSPAAFAHDHLVTSSPSDGSSVTALPSAVVLTFEEPPVAGYTKVRVTDPRGTVVTPASPTTSGSIVTVVLAQDTTSGPYRVVWSVLSDDGHPVSGVVTFTLRTATTTAAPLAKSTATHGGHGTWVIPVVGGIVALAVLSAGGNYVRRNGRSESVAPPS